MNMKQNELETPFTPKSAAGLGPSRGIIGSNPIRKTPALPLAARDGCRRDDAGENIMTLKNLQKADP